MIRKIFLLAVFSFFVFWFAGAYLVKSKLLGILDNIQSDNIRIQYQDASIAGFPINWQITLDHPKITVSDHMGEYELTAEALDFTFSFLMQETIINAGDKFSFVKSNLRSSNDLQDNPNSPNISKHYINSGGDMILRLDTCNRVYEIDDRKGAFWDILDSLSFVQDKVTVSYEDNDIFELSDLKINLEKSEFGNGDEESKQDKFEIKIRGKYNSDTNYFQIKSSMLEANLSYIINEASDGIKIYGYDRLLNIDKLHMDFDEAFLDLAGKIELFKSKLAEGELRLTMRKYSSLVDILVPDNFIVTKEYIKKTITKAIITTEGNKILEDQVSLDLQFSENGLQIGKLPLSTRQQSE